MPLERALFNQIVEFLMPYVMDVSDRKTLTMPALGHLPLINQLVWEGDASAFAVHLVRTLDRWGDNTLELLLTQLSSHGGLSRPQPWALHHLIVCSATSSFETLL